MHRASVSRPPDSTARPEFTLDTKANAERLPLRSGITHPSVPMHLPNVTDLRYRQYKHGYLMLLNVSQDTTRWKDSSIGSKSLPAQNKPGLKRETGPGAELEVMC